MDLTFLSSILPDSSTSYSQAILSPYHPYFVLEPFSHIGYNWDNQHHIIITNSYLLPARKSAQPYKVLSLWQEIAFDMFGSPSPHVFFSRMFVLHPDTVTLTSSVNTLNFLKGPSFGNTKPE
jgi:hypothetical protein